MPEFVHTEIEISSPPSEVRKIFLDFAKYPEWHEPWTITFVPPTPGAELKAGDKVEYSTAQHTATPVVTAISPTTVSWQGSAFEGQLVGHHMFYFRKSEKAAGGTTFVQEESYTGSMSGMLKEGSDVRQGLVASFEKFNGDLKKRAERR